MQCYFSKCMIHFIFVLPLSPISVEFLLADDFVVFGVVAGPGSTYQLKPNKQVFRLNIYSSRSFCKVLNTTYL